MRQTVARIERFRDKRVSREQHGPNGLFYIPVCGQMCKVIASNGEGWEHVSVSLPDGVPSWEIMCQIKALFWRDDELVVQYHPPKAEYVNHEQYCLHLWRPINAEIPRPPTVLV